MSLMKTERPLIPDDAISAQIPPRRRPPWPSHSLGSQSNGDEQRNRLGETGVELTEGGKSEWSVIR